MYTYDAEHSNSNAKLWAIDFAIYLLIYQSYKQKGTSLLFVLWVSHLNVYTILLYQHNNNNTSDMQGMVWGEPELFE